MPTIPEPTSRKSVTLPDTLWEKIGQYRFYRRIPTEAEAIRQLIQAGLDSGATVKMVLDIVAGQRKLIPGQFDVCGQDPFAVIDLLAAELVRYNPALSADQAQDRAKQAFARAQEVGRDLLSAISLLNLDWRWFVG